MRLNRDLPFHDGEPAELGYRGWGAVLAAVAIGFFLLINLPSPVPVLKLLPVALFTGLPLLVLFAVSGGRHSALFRPYGFKEFGFSVVFAALTMGCSLAVGLALSPFGLHANAAAEAFGGLGTIDLLVFLVATFVQIIGEELMTILPLLATLWFCVRKVGMPKGLALMVAVVLSTAIFSAAHLPTYNWNFLQCFGVIGSARLVLTAAFLITRNVWVSAGAHVINDWTEFFLVDILAGHTPINPDV